MKLNYTDWKNEHRAVLESFSRKKVFMSFTGGKDSSVILSFLLLAGKEFGFEFETGTAVYPNDVFPENERKLLGQYWQSRGLQIQWHHVHPTDVLLEDALKRGENPCHACHKIKRKFMYEYLQKIGQGQDGKDIVLILCFTLWDLVSYTLEYLTGGVYRLGRNKELLDIESTRQRFAVTSQRFYPYIETKDGLSIFKPLLRYNDSEIAEVINEESIPLFTTTCIYKSFTPKRIFSQYYRQMNLSFDYDKVLEYAKQSLKLKDVRDYAEMKKEEFVNVL